MLGGTEVAPMDHSATAGGVENVADTDHRWPFRDVDWGTFAYGERHREAGLSLPRLAAWRLHAWPGVGTGTGSSTMHEGRDARSPIDCLSTAGRVEYATEDGRYWLFRDVD